MKSTFIVLDMMKGAFTVLTILWQNQRPLTRRELIEEAGEVELGRTALYSALDALVDAGLIEERHEIWGGKRVVATYPTTKGLDIAEKLIEIQEIINA